MSQKDANLVCPCPPQGTLDVVGKKWAICVVTLLGRYGSLRFGPIRRSLQGVSPATLTLTLRALEKHGLLRRIPVTGDKRATAAYDLTTKGKALYVSLQPLSSWLRQE